MTSKNNFAACWTTTPLASYLVLQHWTNIT